MLDQHADETLHRPERSAVDHHRHVSRAVRADVLELEPLGQLVVELHRTQLPTAAQRVLDVKIDLGAVKGTLPRLQYPFQLFVLQGIGKRLFGRIPQHVLTHPFFRTGRQLDADVLETEVGIDLEEQVDKTGDLVQDL